MQERLGIAPSLPDAEAARLLEETCGIPARDYLDAKEDLRAHAGAHAHPPRGLHPPRAPLRPAWSAA